MAVLIFFAMNTVVLRRISILYDKYYQYIYRKNRNSHVLLLTTT